MFETIMFIIFVFVFPICGLIGVIFWLREVSLFKATDNPYKRECKKCGAHQDMYQSNVEGLEHKTWWEEVYPIGNNPNCECHKYARGWKRPYNH